MTSELTFEYLPQARADFGLFTCGTTLELTPFFLLFFFFFVPLNILQGHSEEHTAMLALAVRLKLIASTFFDSGGPSKICAAVCCSVLQCVAVCCSVLQCVAVCCSVLQCVAVC